MSIYVHGVIMASLLLAKNANVTHPPQHNSLNNFRPVVVERTSVSAIRIF